MQLLRWILALALVTPLQAHDFWIEPSKFQPAAGTSLTLDLKVGERFSGDSVARNPAKIARFFARDAHGAESAIEGLDGRTPAGVLALRTPGMVLVGYRSLPTRLELEPQKFERYLKEEGLETVIEQRRSAGQSERKGSEHFSRCAKALVHVLPSEPTAPPALAGFDQRLGLELELVPENNPYALALGEKLRVRVEYFGQPLAGALVGCQRQGAPEDEVRLRTDAAGRVAFEIEPARAWLVRTVHMVPAPAASGVDWESLWGSLTFEVARPTAR
jgi:hypothetical protein